MKYLCKSKINLWLRKEKIAIVLVLMIASYFLAKTVPLLIKKA